MRNWVLRIALAAAVLAGVLIMVPRSEPPAVPDYEGQIIEIDGQHLTSAKSDGEISVFLAGDTIMTQPWSGDDGRQFLRMVREIRAADVAVVNLEVSFHDYDGYAQAESGGTYLVAKPLIASELAWAGVDMVGHANNHTFDFGSLGVLKNLENVENAGLALAGSGKDLQHARAPRFYDTPNGRVALISAASTFPHFGKASRSRPDIRGRPGLNPLSPDNGLKFSITGSMADLLRRTALTLGFGGTRFNYSRFRLFGLAFTVGDENGVTRGGGITPRDREGNLAAIKKAAEGAELVVFSLHAHSQGEWLRDFAHDAIDAGADIFLVHGPHETRGIEIYQGKPIFYCLGDFVFQYEQVDRHPADFYETLGLPPDATPEDARTKASGYGKRGDSTRREPWESVGAALRFGNGKLLELRLIPLDLKFGAPLPVRGKPAYADPQTARRILSRVRQRSKKYGTDVRYAKTGNLGVVEWDSTPERE